MSRGKLLAAATILFLIASTRLVFAAVVKQETTVNHINLPIYFSTKVTGVVVGYIFDIEGLTSPNARVEFSSSQGNINLETMADDQGVFRFQNAQMPLQTGDFCFTSIDLQQRVSPPLCFAPPPPQTRTTIKGILLPPTLVLEKGIFRQGENNNAQGATTPQSPVKVYLFEEERMPFWEMLDILNSSVYAREGPALAVESKKDGQFSFNLPTYKSTVWRLFVGTQKTQLGENPSPKSNVIQFVALSWWQWLLLKIISLFVKVLKFLFQPISLIIILLFAIAVLARLVYSRQFSVPRQKSHSPGQS